MSYVYFKEKDFVNTPRGKYPKEWKINRFDSIITLEYGKGLPESKRKKGRYPVFGSNGVVGNHNRSLIKGPGIIVGRKGTIGAVALSKSDFWPIDTTYYVKMKNDEIELNWLFYELVHLNLPRLSSADVVPGLKRELVNNLILPLPSLAEQQKIAATLTIVDSTVELADRVIAKTERLKKGLMQQLLTRGIGHTEFKDTLIGKIPKNWDSTIMKKLGELQYGYTTSAELENTGIKFLRITDIENDGSVNWENVPYCRIDEKEFEKYALQKGDLLFARIGATAGKTTYINNNIKGIYASYLIRLKITKENIYPRFLFYFTQSSGYWSQALRQREGQLKKGINATMFSKFIIPIPPFEEQKKIVEILSTVDNKLNLERKEKAALEHIKLGLMDLLLTGKVRIREE